MSVVIDGTNGVSSPDFEVDGVTGQLYPIVSGTAVTASGTSVDFTGIPSWAKRITVMFSGVSTNGTSFYQVQLGTGGSPTTSGYSVYSQIFGIASVAGGAFTTGYGVRLSRAAGVANGLFTFCNVTGNIWAGSYFLADSTNGESFIGGGNVSLSGVLNMVRITTVNGTDTFDAGTINILYE